jgi:hypothetical protein
VKLSIWEVPTRVPTSLVGAGARSYLVSLIAASRASKSWPHGPQALRCAAMPG